MGGVDGEVKSFDFADGWGTIAADDGRTLRFGWSAWRGPNGTRPEVGSRVHVAETGPAVRGMERALGVLPLDGGRAQRVGEVTAMAETLQRFGIALGPADRSDLEKEREEGGRSGRVHARIAELVVEKFGPPFATSGTDDAPDVSLADVGDVRWARVAEHSEGDVMFWLPLAPALSAFLGRYGIAMHDACERTSTPAHRDRSFYLLETYEPPPIDRRWVVAFEDVGRVQAWFEQFGTDARDFLRFERLSLSVVEAGARTRALDLQDVATIHGAGAPVDARAAKTGELLDDEGFDGTVAIDWSRVSSETGPLRGTPLRENESARLTSTDGADERIIVYGAHSS